MKKVLSQLEIKDAIIHRYENLLVDTVTTDENSVPLTGTLSVTLMDNDPLGRDIFFKTVDNQLYLLPTVHMEILALGSIAGTGIVSEGHVVLFTGISNFNHYHPFPINNTLTGTFEKLPDKGPFLRYKGATYLNDVCLASGEMMAIYTKTDQQSSAAKRISFPDFTTNISIESQDVYKPKSITMADTLLYITDTECITSYTYPQTHPFTKGHFPGNPLMMGVMQWASVEDACRTFYMQKNLSGIVSLSFSATITRADGTITAEIRSCTVVCTPHHECLDCSIADTKKITFRSMVKPNETIRIYLTDISITK